MFALVTVGHFNWPYHLPRTTHLLTTGLLLLALPTWFLMIRNRSTTNGKRLIVVGDNSHRIDRVANLISVPVLGYLSPPMGVGTKPISKREPAMTDGGTIQLPPPGFVPLGGLSRLEQTLVEYDVTTVVLAFNRTDRGEFFGVLETCHKYGVETKILRDQADRVLSLEEPTEELVTIDLEPWGPTDRLLKRAFDIVFAGTALLGLVPVLGLIAIAIKMDSPGPVLYSQERTAGFGGTFEIHKFRSMVTDAEAESGAILSAEDDGDVDPRVTGVGRLLRKSHLDEIPQLWSILIGDMSVVGPRPERPKLDAVIQSDGIPWTKRWFVKPGLTGLAQINNVTGFEPEEKLNRDIEYIRRQSFGFDLWIVVRQLYMALRDTCELVCSTEQTR